MKTNFFPSSSKTNIIYRQGDVLLEKLPFRPTMTAARLTGARKIARRNGRLILAEGEVTGHAHVIMDPNAMLFRAGRGIFLTIITPCQVKHEEHAAIDLQPGTYRVRRQREYDPAAFRYVRD